MKLLRLTIGYPEYLENFYQKFSKELLGGNFAAHQSKLYYDAFAWADFWGNALQKKGYETLEIITNAMPTQKLWWRENIGDGHNPSEIDIALAQTKKFNPDILWFDHISLPLLQRIKQELPHLRVVGWLGGTVMDAAFIEHVDILLSCAQETVDHFHKLGKKAEQINHAFEPRILQRTKKRAPVNEFIFIGQIVRSQNFHSYRMQLLEQMVEQTKLKIFSPSADITWWHDTKIRLRGLLYDFVQIGKRLNLEKTYEALPLLNKVAKWQYKPLPQGNKNLAKAFQKAVFGLDMYQAIQDSQTVLNIHADGSAHFASNMRLFETTGMGACLLTDWKKNIHELFEPDYEVITYRNAEECIEKANWLSQNPVKCREIAEAGQKKTLAHHTFTHRIDKLDKIFKGLLST